MYDPPSPELSSSAHDSSGQTKITKYFSSSNRAHRGKRSRTPSQVAAKPPPAKRHKSGDEEMADEQTKSGIDLKEPEAKEEDTVSYSLSTETDESLTDKASAVRVDELSPAETPRVVMTTSDVSPRKSKSSPAIAGFVDERKVGKYILRSTQKDLDEYVTRKHRDEDVTLTKDDPHPVKKTKMLDGGDVSAPEEDSDAAEVSSFTNNGMNLEFYRNKIRSVPDGDYIENILANWKDDFKKLERHHGYIQWLFPIKEIGMNNLAQVLQDTEATTIKEDAVLQERVLRAYKMMLGFYGLELKDEKTGIVGPSGVFQKRMEHLNSSFHNNLRITRILKSLGEFGLEHLKKPLIMFLIQEAFLKNTLVNCRRSCVQFWIPTLKSKEEQQSLEKMVKDLERRERRKNPKFF